MKYYINENSDFLMHHGIKGQKWGERRFQNEDGTLTSEGKARYQKLMEITYGKRASKRMTRDLNKGMTAGQTVNKEYQRRSKGHLKYTIPLNVTSNLAAVVMAGKVSGGNPLLTAAISSAAITVNSIANQFVGKKLNQLQYGYSSFEVSPEGLEQFYNKWK